MRAPRGWRWVALTTVARLESGHTPSRNHDSYWNGGIPWIGIKDARDHNGRRIIETLQTVSAAGLENSAARLLPAGTVCLSRTASVGYALVMGREMATSQDFVNWVCSEALVPEYLMHLFLAERESLLRFAKGTVHKTVYFPEAKALHVCIPARDEQRRIVTAIESYFSRLDAATATLERVQRNLERYRASVLKAAVEGRLVPTEAELAKKEGRSYEPASTLLKRILTERRRRWEEAELAKLTTKGKKPTDDKWKAKYVEPASPVVAGLPGLPEGWCWATIDQVAKLDIGFAFKSARFRDSGVRLLRGDNIEPGRLRWRDAKCWPDDDQDAYAHLIVVPGDIILAMDRPVVSGGLKLARASRADCPCLLVQRVARLRGFDDGVTDHIHSALAAPAFCRHVLDGGQTGTQLPHISGSRIASFTIALPPLGEQRRIAEQLASVTTSIEQAESVGAASERRIARLRQSILKWAFEGRLVEHPEREHMAAADQPRSG